jgi:cardiolipin synthase A/B
MLLSSRISEMKGLLDAIAALVSLISAEKVQAVAGCIRTAEAGKAAVALSAVVGTPAASIVVEQLALAWQKTQVSSEELASMLISASYVFDKVASEQSIELVWTGPTTPFVSARRTEQALLQVINSTEQSLFITSFVAYDVSTIVKALNAASDRGVAISMLLELSQDAGGSINFDVIGKMKTLVPASKLYAWRDKAETFSGGSVHAKVAVADGRMSFITSANLTGYAMEKNMEAGVLITGGSTPRLLSEHLFSLIDTKVVSLV